MTKIKYLFLIKNHNITGWLCQACLFTSPQSQPSHFVFCLAQFTHTWPWRHLNFWLQVQPVEILTLKIMKRKQPPQAHFTNGSGFMGGGLFTLTSKWYVYVAMVKIRLFVQPLFTAMFCITTNQQLSSVLFFHKATQALDANFWDVVIKRSVEILHNCIVPAALSQAKSSCSLPQLLTYDSKSLLFLLQDLPASLGAGKYIVDQGEHGVQRAIREGNL